MSDYAETFKRQVMSKQQREEAVGQVAWKWADKMAEALRKQPMGSNAPHLSGTLHFSGRLESVVFFLDRASKAPCNCKARAERENAGDEDWYWRDEPYNHDCLPRAAKELLLTLGSDAGLTVEVDRIL